MRGSVDTRRPPVPGPALRADPLAGLRVPRMRPGVRRAVRRWTTARASATVVAGRFRALRAALGWAYNERLIDDQPLRNEQGPARAIPRRPIGGADVATQLSTADTALLEALANDTGQSASRRRLHNAGQDLLMVRLAADTGARRGEIVTLRLCDLDGRVLHIDRAVSAGQLTTPKSGHGRTLTLGATTTALWHHLVADGKLAQRSLWGRGCSPPTPSTAAASTPATWATGSPPCATQPESPTQACAGCGTASPRSWPAARSRKRRRGSDTQTPPPPV